MNYLIHTPKQPNLIVEKSDVNHTKDFNNDN